MFEKYREIQRRKAAGDLDESGFTLIELLIVIVVLGILAAVVVFSLGSVTTQSAVSACNADGKTVATAIAAFQADNPGVTVTSTLLTQAPTTGDVGGPFLQSFPSNPGTNYTFSIVAGVLDVAFTSPTVAAATWGPTSCSVAT
jgi:prepilin-type N-terminal cleavage/methylation domain-containing protein